MKPLDELLDPCDVLIDLDASHHGSLVPDTTRRGVMFHYDDSRTDAGAESWFRSKEFKLSYNRAYTDRGRRLRLTPSIRYAAYHAGVCLPEPGVPVGHVRIPGTDTWYPYGQANLAYYGLCVTAGTGQQVTEAQFGAIVYDTAVIFRYHGWTAADVDARLVGHNEKAIFNPRDNPTRRDLWGKLGRKIDPIGSTPAKPVLSLNAGRAAVAVLLDMPEHALWRRFVA